jgi:hypothetical protein
LVNPNGFTRLLYPQMPIHADSTNRERRARLGVGQAVAGNHAKPASVSSRRGAGNAERKEDILLPPINLGVSASLRETRRQ